MRYSLEGTVAGHTHKWALNGSSSSNELGARYVQLHQVPNWPHLQEEDMPDVSRDVYNQPSNLLCLCDNKRFTAVPCSFTRAELKRSEGSQKRQERWEVTKMVRNGMADCFIVLRRITRLKCVSSEVRLSAFSLKRAPSHGSMAPCRSHHGNHIRQELDHRSDPSGTESQNVQLNKIF